MTSIAEHQDSHRTSAMWQRLAESGRDVVSLSLNGERTILLNHPDYARHVLSEKGKYTKNTPPLRLLRTQLADGVATAEGDSWQHQRALLTPAFKDISKLRIITRQCVVETVDRLNKVANTGQQVNISSIMADLTLGVTTKLLFGFNHELVARQCERLGMILDDSTTTLPCLSDDLMNARDDLFRSIRHAVEARSDTLPALASRQLAKDPEYTDRSLEEQVATLLLAGYDTTASALTWAWILLTTHQDEYQTWLRALDEDEHTSRTADVFFETLRLCPPAWIIGRRAVADDRIGNITIPGGSVVAISPYLLHRHPQFWNNPELFQPARFGRSGSRPSHRYAYIPFGAGHRVCMGSAYALHEARIILSTLGRHFYFDAVHDELPAPEHKFVLRAPRTFLATVHRRRSSPS